MLDVTDYKCETRYGIYLCAANTNATLGVYNALQDLLRLVGGTMATYRTDVPKSLSTLETDGRIGPTTALAAQIVLAAFNQLVPMPADLLPILSDTSTGDEIIRVVARQADLVLAYLNQTLLLYPSIMRPPAPAAPPVAPKKPKISTLGWVGLGGAVVTIGGLVLIGRGVQRATDGKGDRSQFLPDPTPEEQAAAAAEDAAAEAAGDLDEADDAASTTPDTDEE